MTIIRFSGAVVAGIMLLGACGGECLTIVEPHDFTPGAAIVKVGALPSLATVRLRVYGPGMSNPTVMGNNKRLFDATDADTTTFFVAIQADGGELLEIQLSNRELLPKAVVEDASAGKADGYRTLDKSLVQVTTTLNPDGRTASGGSCPRS